MKKIYKLKKWLTLEETAKRLSIEVGEEIETADILQLAVDEQLKMSVYFPHDWVGKICDLTTDENIVEENKKEIIGLDGNPFIYSEYEKCNETEYVKILPEKYNFKAGIYELKLIGNEKIDLEWQLKEEQGLPTVDIFNLSGFYVKNKDGIVIERQSKFSNKPPLTEKQKDIIININRKSTTLNDEEIQIGINNMDKERNYPIDSFYYPCPGLGEIEGAFFVVQTEHLNEFINILDDENSNNLTMERSLYLLGEVLNTVKSKAKKWTQSAIIDEILQQRENQNKTVQGLEKRKIEDYFSVANKKLKSD